MKLILNIFKSLSVLYWALAASLFVSMVFFPGAIDTLHNGYNEFVNAVVQPESSEVSSSLESSSEEVISSSEESSSSEEVSSEETSSSEEVPASEPLRMNSGSEESSEEIVDEETSSEDEVTCLALECEEETPVDPIPEEEVVLELTSLTREEFVSALESILIYSALVMLPFTILVFSLSSKLNDYSKEEVADEVVAEEVPVSEPKEKKEKQSSKKIKEESIGLTGLKVRK